MPEDVEPVVRGIQKRFRDLSVDVREERIIRYIVNQLGQGRKIDDIMGDAYLTAHTSDVFRLQVLQNPAVIRAIEEELHRQFADYQSATGTAAGNPPPEPGETRKTRSYAHLVGLLTPAIPTSAGAAAIGCHPQTRLTSHCRIPSQIWIRARAFLRREQ